jgi:hypothetical protein
MQLSKKKRGEESLNKQKENVKDKIQRGCKKISK